MNAEYTQRVGLLDGDEEVYAWMCPFCRSEFDLDGKVLLLNGSGDIKGEA